MQKKILYIIMGILVLSLVACGSGDDATSNVVNQELLKLMPNEGFKWAYVGPAEYYHEMVLDSITGDETQKIYYVKGEVEDLSAGDSQFDYSIDLYYEINGDSIVQRMSADMALDNNFEALTLIKAPLEEGTKWTETVKDKTGKKVTIEGEIFYAEADDNGMVYKVSYTDKKSDYSETRHIREGFGIVVFTQKVMIDDEEFNYGYGLFGKESGYNKETVISNETEDPSEDNNSEETSDSEDTTATEDTTDTSDTTTEDTSDNTEAEASNEDEEAAVRQAIENFNDAWIKFVNENDQSFFDYVTTSGVAYKNAKNFDSTGLKEEFLVMQVNQVTVNGSTATAKVREEIEKTKDGDVSIAKYNWLYNLVKKDGQWLVDGYKKQ